MAISIQKRIKIKSLFSGIGRKFILYFISFSIVPIIFISIIGYHISEQIVVNQNLRYLQLQSELVKNRLGEFLKQARFEISPENPDNNSVYQWIANKLQSPLPRNCQATKDITLFFQEKLHKHSFFYSYALIDENRKIYCFTDSTIHLLPPSFLKKLIKSNEFLIFRNERSSDQSPILALAEPLTLQRLDKQGYVVGFIKENELSEILYFFSSDKYQSDLFLTDASGKLLYPSTYRYTIPDNNSRSENYLLPKEGIVIGKAGERVLRSLNYCPSQNWYIISEIPYDQAMANLIIFRNQAILGVSILLILLIGLAFYVSRRISVPIRKLVYAAQDIGDGLLHAPIKINTGDEIGMLAREFDEMRKKLLDSYENLEKKVEERTEDLRQAQFQIMHQEKMASLGLLAAGIAHEIGNPLTSISSLTQLLKRRLKDEKNLNYLSTIMKNIDRISKIVRELVDFSRPSNYETKLTDVNEIARAAVGIVKYDSRSKHINFSLDLSPDLPRIVLVADQLLQVFINILFNAVDAMEGFGNDLFLKTFRQDNHIVIEITDTGCGIPESEINKIFEPFYTTKEVGKGTGLGLSVSYGIIRNFNGDIAVHSKVGQGSTFTIKLPINQPKREQ